MAENKINVQDKIKEILDEEGVDLRKYKTKSSVVILGAVIYMIASIFPMISFKLYNIRELKIGIFTVWNNRYLFTVANIFVDHPGTIMFVVRVLGLMGLILGAYLIYVTRKKDETEIEKTKLALAIHFLVTVLASFVLGSFVDDILNNSTGWGAAEYTMILSLIVLHYSTLIQYIQKKGVN